MDESLKTAGGKAIINRCTTLRPQVKVARRVIEGAGQVCDLAGIALAGGHSIDTPQPIFGLAVTGVVAPQQVKKNSAARPGCRLYLTKPLGTGILTTAEKKSLLSPEHAGLATEVMCRPNSLGEQLARLPGVAAMTDVTGFGLPGYLSEMCQGAGGQADLWFSAVPRLPGVDDSIAAGCVPGGTQRNYASYHQLIGAMDDRQRQLLCDPQTSGCLLLAVTQQINLIAIG